MAWQHSPHRRGALLVLSLRQSYLHQNPHSEFTLWGFNGAYYYFGLSYRWDVSP